MNPDTAADQKFRRFLEENKAELSLVAHWGDGHCGHLIQVLKLTMLGYVDPPRKSSTYMKHRKKGKILPSLAREVFERDAYRCVMCNGYTDLTCDHIYPESKGGPTTKSNLQTLCSSCNSKKGTKAVEEI